MALLNVLNNTVVHKKILYMILYCAELNVVIVLKYYFKIVSSYILLYLYLFLITLHSNTLYPS